MKEQEQQKLHDFVQDVKMLSEQYGWELTDALDKIGWKPKTKDELLEEYAREKYTTGTVFIPLGKKRSRTSSGKAICEFDRVYVWEGLKLFLVYDPTINEWAEIIN